MRLSISDVKIIVANYERAERWMDIIKFLSDEWRQYHDANVAALCLHQCFLFIEWVDDTQCHELQVERDLCQALLDQVIDYGLDNYSESPCFMWRLGFLMKGGIGTGYMMLNSRITIANFDEICIRALTAAYEKWPSLLVEWTMQQAKGNWNWHLSWNMEQKKTVIKELKSLNLQDNIVDVQLKQELTTTM